MRKILRSISHEFQIEYIKKKLVFPPFLLELQDVTAGSAPIGVDLLFEGIHLRIPVSIISP